MLTFSLTEKFLSKEEQKVFVDFLYYHKLDEGIWGVFESMFNSKTRYTYPVILRAFEGDDLIGVAVLIKCHHTGRALFKNGFLASLTDSLKLPVHLWIKFGCCMDMMSNPGFVKEPEKTEEILKNMIQYLRKNCLLTFINDYSSNSYLFPGASAMPSLPHGLINCSSLASLDDYLRNFKNIKKKLKTFSNRGGIYINIENKLDESLLPSLEKCFKSTADKSVMYLPYQDLYLKSALHTSKRDLDNVYYFVATMNGDFIGYQAAIKTGSHLNALHGAFDRTMKTTYHAYDILFVKMTEFALENNITSIDMGAVLNYTKQKMVNETIDMSYFIFSKFRWLQAFFSIFLKFTNIQGKEQLKFSMSTTSMNPS